MNKFKNNPGSKEIRISYYRTRKLGFSLLELILAVAIFALSSVALGTLLIDSNQSTQLSLDRTEALFYAKEGIEATRSIRDADWSALAVGDYGLDNSSSTWAFSGSSDLIDDKYTRVINISTSSQATSSKLITSTVSWNLASSRTVSVALTTLLTDWRKAVSTSSIPTDGLVSYWSFNDAASSTAVDNWDSNDGTVYGATATTSVKGVADEAYYFDGVNDNIILPNMYSSMGNSFTISAWVKQSSYTGLMQDIFDNGGGNIDFSTDGTWSSYASGDLGFSIWNGASYNQATVHNVDFYKWHHIVGIADSSLSTMTIYLDGVNVASGTYTGTTAWANSGDWTIGSNRIGANQNRFVLGSIDEVRLYDRALTGDEVAAIYNAEKPAE